MPGEAGYFPEMSRETAVLITLLLYNLVLVVTGLLLQKRNQDGTDFYLGGRRLGPAVAAISASASSSSAWTLLGVSGAAYAWGISAAWLFPSCVGGFLLNWYLLAPHLQHAGRRQGAITVTEVLSGPEGSDFRRAITIVASCIILVSLGVYVAAQYQGAGKSLSETFQIPLSTSILLGAVVVVLYTTVGGFWAVSVTDTIQGTLMALAAILLPLAALQAVGGPVALYEALKEVPVPGYWSPIRQLPLLSALGLVLGFLGIGLGYPGQPHVVNRFMALREGKASMQKARRISIGWAVIVYAGMILLGWCGRVLVPDLSDPEVVFISLANTLFSPVMSGIILAAVLSAIMSTVDSQLLVASSTVCHDLSLGKGAGSRHLLRRSRFVVLLLSVGAVVAALYGTPEIFSRVLFAWAAMGAAFGPLLLVVVRRKSVSGKARLIAVIAGFTASVGAYYLVGPEQPWKGSLERFFPFCLVFLLLAHSVLKDRHRD